MVDLSIVFCMLTMVKPSIATPGVSVSISSKSIITPFPMASTRQELMLKEKQEQSDAQFKKEKEEVRSWTEVSSIPMENISKQGEHDFSEPHVPILTLLGPISGKYHDYYDYDGKAIFNFRKNPENFRCSLFVRTRLYEVIT